MLKIATVLAVIPFVLTFAAPASAQDALSADLPAACKSDAGDMAGSMSMGDTAMGHTADVDEAHAALMDGMDAMNKNMMTGVANPDIDVAFVCGMIPHHQGAIGMAQAELKFGKDEWAKAFAQKVIDAQTQEIADMTKWLEENAK